MKKRAISDDAKAEKKQRMLDAALDEFYEKGFTAARMDDIAARCGLSKGTLYLYFNSKETLFNGLIETVAKPKQGHIVHMLQAAPSAHLALTALTEFVPQVIAEGRLPKLIKILIGDCKAFPEIIQGYRKKVIEQALAALAELFERSNQSGETRIAQPALFARLVVAPVVLSAIWQAVFAQDGDPPLDLKALFVLHRQMLMNALTMDPTEDA
ncbi:TetR/AcrR family transcriptional regulator [Marinicella meishanensis]|uniref:TetR/AcrR family transcriptional regulator n=1 Tax=Marinicella meishanensis TaxID=2873263 RepID=UPI001CBD1D58|nr:TetR/AcrR family transcriptional regulator [Marinicella sp. NBU2979]